MDNTDDQNLNIADPTAGGDEMSEEIQKTSPENYDELGKFGTEPDPEVVTQNNTFEDAKEMGLYPDANEDLPVPVGSTNLD